MMAADRLVNIGSRTSAAIDLTSCSWIIEVNSFNQKQHLELEKNTEPPFVEVYKSYTV